MNVQNYMDVKKGASVSFILSTSCITKDFTFPIKTKNTRLNFRNLSIVEIQLVNVTLRKKTNIKSVLNKNSFLNLDIVAK